MSEDRGVDRMTSEMFWHLGGELGQDRDGGRKWAELKAVALFLKTPRLSPYCLGDKRLRPKLLSRWVKPPV